MFSHSPYICWDYKVIELISEDLDFTAHWDKDAVWVFAAQQEKLLLDQLTSWWSTDQICHPHGRTGATR